MTYFTSRRRKLGVVVLFLACLAAAGWGRSHIAEQSIHIPYSKSLTYHATLARCGLQIDSTQEFELEDNQRLRFVNNRIVIENCEVMSDGQSDRSDIPEPVREAENTMILQAARVVCESQVTIIAYWLIILPLTLLSAWLLLCQPRMRTPVAESGV